MAYPTEPACYFQLEWIPSGPIYREPLHGKKDRFNQEVRPRDPIVIRGNRSPVRKTNMRNYDGGRKLTWVPVKRAGPKHVKSSDDLDNARALKFGEHQSAEGVENNPEASYVDAVKSGPVQRKDAGTQEKDLINTLVASSSASQKVDSVSTPRTNSAMRNSNSGASRRWFPIIFGTSTQHVNPSTRVSDIFRAGGTSNQRSISSAKDRLSESKQIVRQYRPMDLGGRRTKSVAPGTKPGPRWCPTGLTHTQKRRVQRLRALEIKEEIAEKCDELFNPEKHMVPTWREKRIAEELSRTADDTISDANSENNRDASDDMDVDQGG